MLREMLVHALVNQGFDVTQAGEPSAVMEQAARHHLDLAVLGPSAVGTGNNLELAQCIRKVDGSIPVLLIVVESSEELAIAALRAGVTEYLRHPFCSEELSAAINRCLPDRRDERCLSDRGDARLVGGERMIGESPQMQQIRAMIARVAPTDSTLLITGETGTGKELVAELVHHNSLRHGKRFITINCAAIPDSLLESELFGYDKGAFTGALSANGGRLKAGEGGTIFLDEIGDMSGHAQAKMLRMIESKEIERLGRGGTIKVDIRIIAATNHDLDQLSREGKFRQDLFFRLNVSRVHLPPLRERKEDIPALIDYYVRALNVRFGREVRSLSEEALGCLLAHDWPGNVRELKNLLEAVFVNLPSVEISLAELPTQLRRQCAGAGAVSPDERARLLWALSTTNWNKRKAADKLHWSRMTLYRKMARYKISRTSQSTEMAVHHA